MLDFYLISIQRNISGAEIRLERESEEGEEE